MNARTPYPSANPINSPIAKIAKSYVNVEPDMPIPISPTPLGDEAECRRGLLEGEGGAAPAVGCAFGCRRGLRSAHNGATECAEVGCDCLLVVFGAVRDLLLSAKHLFFSAKARRQISLRAGEAISTSAAALAPLPCRCFVALLCVDQPLRRQLEKHCAVLGSSSCSTARRQTSAKCAHSLASIIIGEIGSLDGHT